MKGIVIIIVITTTTIIIIIIIIINIIRFISAWTKDGYRDYLDTKSTSKIPTVEKAPTTVLNSLLNRQIGSIEHPSSSSSPQSAKKSSSNIAVYIDDYEDFGDSRIEATQLRKLLKDRPDIATLLSNCMKEADITSST